MLEKVVALQLHLDDVSLLLLGQLEQIHDDKPRLVIVKINALWARGDDEPVAARHELEVHKCLDDISHACCLVDAIHKNGDGTHFVSKHEHGALLFPVGKLVVYVPAHEPFRILQQRRRVITKLTQQPYDALHEHNDGHEGDTFANRVTESFRQQEEALLDHPRLTGARPSAAEHRLCSVTAL